MHSQPSQTFLNRAMAIAASENLMDDVASAINKGADPTYMDDFGYTPAMYFAEFGNVNGIIMVYNMALAKDGTPGSYNHSDAATKTLKVDHRRSVSPAILLAHRGDVAGLLRLAAVEPKIMAQPVMANLRQADKPLTLQQVTSLLKSGFTVDDKFEAVMRKLGFSTLDTLRAMDDSIA